MYGGMAKKHEPAAANATGKRDQGWTTRAKYTTTPSSLSLQAINAGQGVGTQQTGLSPQAQRNRHRRGQAHHGMARRVWRVRTHVDTSAKTGMLYAAQGERSRNEHGAHAPIIPLSHRAQRERTTSRQGKRPRHAPERRQGKSACQGEG